MAYQASKETLVHPNRLQLVLEIGAYVRRRLADAGAKTELFTEDAVGVLHHETRQGT